MLRDGLLILYCVAVGFVAAGVGASFYKMVTHEAPRFVMLGRGWLAAVSTYLFCALAGPAIIIDLIIQARPLKQTGATMLVAGLAVAVLWSLCSGILVLDVVLKVRDSLA